MYVFVCLLIVFFINLYLFYFYAPLRIGKNVFSGMLFLLCNLIMHLSIIKNY